MLTGTPRTKRPSPKAISHEIAHYIQLVKWGRSSCESDIILNNGNYSAELAKEHEEWIGEIYRMIKEEYSEWERQWKKI